MCGELLIAIYYHSSLLFPSYTVDWLILVVQFMYNSEGLQELIEVYTAIFVKVDTSGKVINRPVVNLDPQVGTKEVPCVAKLFSGDQT